MARFHQKVSAERTVNMTTPPALNDNHLYVEIAERISSLISHRTFRPGDRIPSVRELSRQFRVSITTVTQAYRTLEDQGLIEARPQSGYYVKISPLRMLSTPRLREQLPVPCAVTSDQLVMKVLKDTRNPALVQFGAGVPNPEHIPTGKLTRITGAMGRRHYRLANTYDIPPGCELLRTEVSRRAITAGCVLSPDDIVTTCGAQEAITLALRATCRPGDTVAIESPLFYGILQAIELLGLKALELPTHPDTGMDLDALSQAVSHHRISAVIVCPNFQNPLGHVMPDNRKRDLVRLLAEREIPLIEDDIYGDLSFTNERPRAVKSYDVSGSVLLCSSVSKTLAPGYRVGWIAPGRYQSEIERLKMATNIASPTLPQLAVADFLAHGGYDHHLRRIRRLYSGFAQAMSEAVARYFPDGTRANRPTGGYFLWVELPRGIDGIELHREAIRSGISIAPGPIFSPSNRYRNFIRLNYTAWFGGAETFVEKLGRLAGAQ